MMCNITKQMTPKGPHLAKGLEAFNLLIFQTSSDMYDPLLPLLSYGERNQKAATGVGARELVTFNSDYVLFSSGKPGV